MADINVAQSLVAVEIVAADPLAVEMVLENDSTDTFYGKWAASGLTVTENNYSFSAAPGEKLALRKLCTGRLIGVWATGSGGTLRGSRI